MMPVDRLCDRLLLRTAGAEIADRYDVQRILARNDAQVLLRKRQLEQAGR